MRVVSTVVPETPSHTFEACTRMIRSSSLLQVKRNIAVLAKRVLDEFRTAPTASRNPAADLVSIALALSGKSLEITKFILE